MPGLARRLPRGVRAGRARRRRLRPTPAPARHEPDDRARAVRVLRRLRSGLADAKHGSSPAIRCCSVPATPASSPTSTRATRVHAGRRSASATSPTPRTRRSAPTCSRPAGSRSTSPAAAVLHAHDYGAVEFMRRYFDEYRGLRETTGHVEPFGVLDAARHVRREVAADRRWMAERGSTPRHARAGPRAPPPPRRTARLLGARVALAADAGSAAASGCRWRDARRSRRPAPQRETAPAQGARARTRRARALRRIRLCRRRATSSASSRARSTTWSRRSGATAPRRCSIPSPGMAERERLRLAMVIPPFSRGSGGHNTLFQIFSRLEQRGHACSVWLADYYGYARVAVAGGAAQRDQASSSRRSTARSTRASTTGRAPTSRSRPAGRPFTRRFSSTTVGRAPTSSTTTSPSSSRPRPSTSLAADTYRHGLHCIAASPWLRDLLIERYGASADAFQLGVDHDTYHPRPVARQPDTVIYYARHATPRRAVPIGLMALAELKRRRPGRAHRAVRHRRSPRTPPSTYEHLGVLSPEQLSWLYSEATVGLCLSLTNFSLMPKEMLACGLPCVELAGISAESIFGADGPLELAPLDPNRIADAIERLLEDPQRVAAALTRRHRVRRLTYLGARHRRGRSRASTRAARARTKGHGHWLKALRVPPRRARGRGPRKPAGS